MYGKAKGRTKTKLKVNRQLTAHGQHLMTVRMLYVNFKYICEFGFASRFWIGFSFCAVFAFGICRAFLSTYIYGRVVSIRFFKFIFAPNLSHIVSLFILSLSPHFEARKPTSESKNIRERERLKREIVTFFLAAVWTEQTEFIRISIWMKAYLEAWCSEYIHHFFVLFMHLNRKNIFIFGIDKINTPMKGDNDGANENVCYIFEFRLHFSSNANERFFLCCHLRHLYPFRIKCDDLYALELCLVYYILYCMWGAFMPVHCIHIVYVFLKFLFTFCGV